MSANIALAAAVAVAPSASRSRRLAAGGTLLAACVAAVLLATWFTLLGDSLPQAFKRAIALALATLVSEDLTCITAGQLIVSGSLHPFVGVSGCLAGIYLGDLGLWLVGRALGRRLPGWDWAARRLPAATLERFGRWFDANAGKAVVAARFIPGTRLPLYVAAGMLGRRGGAFAGWTFVAALVWTPALIALAAWLGDGFAMPLRRLFGNSGAVLAGVLVLFAVLRLVGRIARPAGRQRLYARCARLWRWEFWPAWLFYAPVVPWIALHSLRRGGLRGFSSITAANPGISDGGFVGESKYRILSSLASRHVAATALIEPGAIGPRMRQFAQAVEANRWTFPLVLKPDVGQRGVGVKRARSLDDVTHYLSKHAPAVIVQAYHAGPFEAGIFYVRRPGEPVGTIFSITDKHFPEVIGDGTRTLERIIWDHPRYRMQADTFLRRHAGQLGRVPAVGERFRLAHAGNHCQGTMFRDGGHLITPALERAIDSVARSFAGFYFGRFDVRYADVDAFKRGEDFTVIELNGVTSESTNLYDPAWSLCRAYRTLFRQWSVLFDIADANVRTGVRPTPPLDLLRNVAAYYRRRQQPFAVSD
jgi:membrane protein DedA with SNARE-associated domain